VIMTEATTRRQSPTFQMLVQGSKWLAFQRIIKEIEALDPELQLPAELRSKIDAMRPADPDAVAAMAPGIQDMVAGGTQPGRPQNLDIVLPEPATHAQATLPWPHGRQQVVQTPALPAPRPIQNTLGMGRVPGTLPSAHGYRLPPPRTTQVAQGQVGRPLVTPGLPGTSPAPPAHPSPAYSGSGRLPTPGRIDDKRVKAFLSDPALIRLHLAQIFMYILEMTPAMYPQSITFFIEHSESLKWNNSWFEVLTQSGGVWDESNYIEAYTHFLSGEVRAPAVVALEEILGGKVQQGSEAAGRYAQRFFARSRLLLNESQQSLCKHFILGLKPELRVKCCLDRDNKEWQSLYDLVQYTLAEEVRLNMSRSLDSRDADFSPAAPASAPFRQYTKKHFTPAPGQGSAKRRREDGSVAAAAPAAASGGANPSSSSGAVAAAAPDSRRSERERPVTECPLYGLRTSADSPLTAEQKQILRKWGVCWRCKRARHLAKDCKADQQA